MSARHRHEAAIELLLDRRADIEPSDSGGLTPLHTAAVGGHQAAIGLLLDRGAGIEANDFNKWAPLHSVWLPGIDAGP